MRGFVIFYATYSRFFVFMMDDFDGGLPESFMSPPQVSYLLISTLNVTRGYRSPFIIRAALVLLLGRFMWRLLSL